MDLYLFVLSTMVLAVVLLVSLRMLNVVVLAYQAKAAVAQKMAALARKKAAQLRRNKGKGKDQDDDDDSPEGFIAGMLDGMGIDPQDLAEGDPAAVAQLQEALSKLPKPNGSAGPAAPQVYL